MTLLYIGVPSLPAVQYKTGKLFLCFLKFCLFIGRLVALTMSEEDTPSPHAPILAKKRTQLAQSCTIVLMGITIVLMGIVLIWILH